MPDIRALPRTFTTLVLLALLCLSNTHATLLRGNSTPSPQEDGGANLHRNAPVVNTGLEEVPSQVPPISAQDGDNYLSQTRFVVDMILKQTSPSLPPYPIHLLDDVKPESNFDFTITTPDQAPYILDAWTTQYGWPSSNSTKKNFMRWVDKETPVFNAFESILAFTPQECPGSTFANFGELIGTVRLWKGQVIMGFIQATSRGTVVVPEPRPVDCQEIGSQLETAARPMWNGVFMGIGLELQKINPNITNPWVP